MMYSRCTDSFEDGLLYWMGGNDYFMEPLLDEPKLYLNHCNVGKILPCESIYRPIMYPPVVNQGLSYF